MTQDPSPSMTSTRPYLIRAIHEWIIDNGWTPYLLADADEGGALLPGGYAQDGKIVLNVSYNATKHLALGNEKVTFTGRFNGVSMPVSIPTDAVLAVYAKETGAGMAFHEEPQGDDRGGLLQGEERPRGKEGRESGEVEEVAKSLENEGSTEERPERDKPGKEEILSSKPPTPGKPSRPTLRIVK
uniref:Stringent starvation protein B n=1 Tax=Candidatus Kentrum sp. LFY TaxID=2126342 RepID=A0A450U931_9GAMM|nr:MAG: stringent starvation protein B [Candidatus Kentron sp. LFY]